MHKNNTKPNFEIINKLFIGPRVGTISPWSSRATDIILNCGIDVLRAEKLNFFAFNTKSNKEIPKKDLIKIGSIIYDQMTESIFLEHQNIEELFVHKDPSKNYSH